MVLTLGLSHYFGNNRPKYQHPKLREKNLKNKQKVFTLPETNIAPENEPSQEETSIPTIHFYGPC